MKLSCVLIQAALYIFLGLCLEASCFAQDINLLRESGVAKARQGNFQEAIPLLEELFREHSDDEQVRSDLIVVLLWNKNTDEAFKLYQEKPFSYYPEYVHLAALDSCRHTGNTINGLNILEYLIQQDPVNSSFQLKKAQFLIDDHQYEEAREILDKLAQSDVNKTDLNKVYAYLNTSKTNWVGALDNYQQVLSINSQDKEAIQGQQASLLQLNAPFGAAINMSDHRGQDIQDTARLLYIKAAIILRWSGFAAKSQEEALVFASKALTYQLKAKEMLAPENELQAKIDLDMVVSYKNMGLYDQSFGLYEKVSGEQDVPTYVIQAAADSLLALQEPELARDLYQKVLENDPGNYQAKLSLFYCFIESEDFESAYQLIEKEKKKQAPFYSYAGSSEQVPNDKYLDMIVLSGQARLYGDQLQLAWEQIEELVHHAPANDWLVQVAGETAQARGWPRKAHGYFQSAVLLNGENNDALAGKGQSRLQLRDYDGVEEVVYQLKEKYPISQSTLQLEKDIFWSKRPDLWADIVFSYSEGPEQSGDGILATTEVISSPISNSVYVSAYGRYNWAEIPEGHESLTRIAGGFEYVADPWDILAQVNYNSSTLEEAGGLLRASWTPDDHWQVNIQGELFSEATPLRALFYSIRADKVGGSVQYRWHESRQFSLTVSSALFTDDNERFEVGASMTQRLIDIPHFDFDGRLELYGSTNSREDAPYYNPKSDFSIKGVGRADHVLYRHYDNSVVQRFEGGVGLYAQEDFDSGLTGYIRYEQRYKFHPRFEGVLGGEVGSNRYDGQAEPYYKFNFLIHAKF